MGPDAYDMLCDKISPKNPDLLTYEETVEIMQLHYNPEPLEIAEIFRFLQRKQQDGETVQEYITVLRKLAATCKFESYHKKAIRNQFVFGLTSEHIQSRLLEIKDLTLEKAIEVATSIEMSTRDAAQLHGGKANYNMNQIKLPEKKIIKTDNISQGYVSQQNFNKSSFKCFRCGSNEHLANRCNIKSRLFCNFCKKEGHLSKVCMKSKDTADSVHTNQVEEILTLEHTEFRNKFMILLQINNINLEIEADSGAAVSIMSHTMFKELFPLTMLHSTDLKLVSYCKSNITVLGFAEVNVECNGVFKKLNLYIVDHEKEPLIGREWIRQLNIQFTSNIQKINNFVSADSEVQNLLEKYAHLFKEDIGKINNIQAKLNIKPDAKPVYLKARKVPYALIPKIDRELTLLEEQGILIKINSSEYATPIVPVVKANGRVRLCGDFRSTVNQCLIVDHHPLPTIDELFSSMAGGDKFTKLDLSQAYLQMEVAQEDQKYLVLNTHKGLYKCTRLMFGISSAPSIWQREIEKILADIPRVSVFLDDIKITAVDDISHLQTLDTVLQRLSEYNIRVNLNKCQFMKSKIEYCGYDIDKYGIHKSSSKIEAIQNAKIPSNKTEVRAFIGLINYYGRFFRNLSHTLFPLNNLLKNNVPFNWTQICQKSFDKIKEDILSDQVLTHFDPTLPIILATDASSYAIGAVISHVYPDGSERPIQFASQTLSTQQQKYTQLDKEAYSIIFGIKKFYYFLFGRIFTLYTDSKPLIHIFSPSKCVSAFTTTRMQHYSLFLQSFQYDIKYKNTKDNGNADALSRLPMASTKLDLYDEVDVFEISQIGTLPVTLKELADETAKDMTLNKILVALKSGMKLDRKDCLNSDISQFSIQNECIFRGHQAVIPGSLQRKILEELHVAHFGAVKMKSLARSYCYWPRITYDIEDIARNCAECNKIKNNPEQAPIHPWEPANEPFQRVHIDFLGPFNNTFYFILVDAYSRWPEIHAIKNITTENTILLCDKIFCSFGIPKVIVSDNASVFTSFRFKNYLKENGIFHKLSAPYHPATNGLAERCVQTFKNTLNAIGGTVTDRQKKVNIFLQQYRKTPHSITSLSPAELFLGRNIRTKLDLLKPYSADAFGHLDNARVREFVKGERVAVREYGNSKNKWKFGRVDARIGKLHYLIKLDNNIIWKRHIDQMTKIGEYTPCQGNNSGN